jgi:hypothetical protein
MVRGDLFDQFESTGREAHFHKPGVLVATSLLVNSLDDMRKSGYEYNDKKTAALYGQANWHISDPLTITTGLKLKSQIGTALDYTAGLFAMRARTSYQSYSNWEQDAGAWYASNAQYWGGTGSIPVSARWPRPGPRGTFWRIR